MTCWLIGLQGDNDFRKLYLILYKKILNIKL